MKYMGSKNRIAKFILPIMIKEANEKGITTWVEPFVGGANMIDKAPNNFQRIGIDYNAHTIEALIAIRDLVDKLPNEVAVEYYKSLKGTEPNPITSLIRFGASFGGKFENGYARSFTNKGIPRNHWDEAKRNAQKQSPKLQGVKFINGSYDEYSDFENCLIYCDPPYEGTTSYKTGAFDHTKFWDWCRKMSEKNLVFVSEYKAPDDFICVWEGEVKTNFASQRDEATHKVVEKLFKFSPTNVNSSSIVALAGNSVYPHFFNKKQDKMKELEINKMAVPKKERIINQMDIDYYDGLNKSLSEQYILKLEQEIRSWSIINKI